ncbi:diaminobutyrate acetyltransferase [Bordetella genomosp. 11]|uniref:L-2,4-diaminobutyric acid acetyltransferase n=1 Tax=Bordetella genomosp. 11 TaxID=1416808 RepID=A0A261UF24_9BORD|nr:diaminobutyrate acetyltransferase [Bordetella genomosp. 11]OZI59810.1 diaminobutyrate acetyltransferase [Bordetella genomosp. 11]
MNRAFDMRAATPLAAQEPSHLFRIPRPPDGAVIHRLVGDCPPLDQNTVYAYLLLCEHFPATCVVAESPGGSIDGFVSAYVPPGRTDRLFVWQVAVHERARGQRLARRMLHALLRRPELADIRHVETTVGPDNHASRRTFISLAGDLGAHVAEQPFFGKQLFGQADHDDEMLLRIGPIASIPR